MKIAVLAALAAAALAASAPAQGRAHPERTEAPPIGVSKIVLVVLAQGGSQIARTAPALGFGMIDWYGPEVDTVATPGQ